MKTYKVKKKEMVREHKRLIPELRKAGLKKEAKGYDIASDKSSCYVPTLSELIEACGDRFGKLVKEDDCWYGYDAERKFTEHGRTPEEAVAKLWIELNKK